MTASLDRPLRPAARRAVRASAIYDLAVTAPFALPVTAPLLFAGLAEVQAALGSGAAAPASDPFSVMFANLMGGLVVVWATFRILRPSFLAGLADVVARLFFSLGMTAAVAATGSPLIGVMLVLELLWALAQAIALVADRRAIRAVVAAPSPAAVP